MNPIDFNDADFPLVRIGFVGLPTPAQFEDYLSRLEATLKRCEREGKKCAMLFDARESGLVSASIRRRQAEWMREHRELSARCCVGYAFVIDSPLVRGALTAILWLAPMPAPHRVVTTRSEGETWLIGQLPSKSRVA